MHSSRYGHETPVRTLPCAPGRVGTGWMPQLVPFQRSASIPETTVPTATQAAAEEHDTPFSWLVVAPLGLGVLWSVQPRPSHASASVSDDPAWLKKNPVAVHALADVQDTAVR